MSLHEHQELFADDNDATASEVSSVMTSDDERIQSEDDILVDDDLTSTSLQYFDPLFSQTRFQTRK